MRQHALQQVNSTNKRNRIYFTGGFSTWEEASAQCVGYDDIAILDKVLSATLKVKKGEAAYERDSVLFDRIEYSWPMLSGLMLAAARRGGKLNVLDYGGSLGSSFFQNRKFLQKISEMRWNIVEQPHFVRAGQSYFQDTTLRFYSSIKECCEENTPNVVLLSSVLQYIEKPYDILRELSTIDADLLLIDRSPFYTENTDKIMMQSVSPEIYEAEYPSWIFSEDKFLRFIGEKWDLIESFMSPEGSVTSACGTSFSFKGYIGSAKNEA